MSKPPVGLKARCYRGVGWLAACTWIVISVGLVFFEDWQTDAMFDSALRQLAHTALSYSDHELSEIEREGGPRIDEHLEDHGEGPYIFQVWKRGHVLAYRSSHAPQIPLTSGQPGFADTLVDGVRFRAYTVWNEDQSFQIQMAASPERRDTYFAWRSLAVSFALLTALLIFMGLVRRQLGRSFAPLDTTAQVLAGKSPADLSAVPTPLELPELGPVIDAFNHLMARVDRSMRQEQRFANDAAHAFRTPLQSLKILTRNLRVASSSDQKREALDMIDQVVDKSSRLVDQLLQLARLDYQPDGLVMTDMVDLVVLAESVTAEIAALPSCSGAAIEVVARDRDVRVRGNADMLRLAVRNLVENAVSFAAPEGKVLIEVERDAIDNSAMVRVHDNGYGVPAPLRPRIFSLFFTVPRSGSVNAGLGLPLVARVLHTHSGSAHIDDSPLLGGAMAWIRLPAANPLPT